ncbi:MAG: hypothetical protein HQL46_04395 [Gammaproteobacteria bacterium]|nr:hypothetical protein [Gammaproteobacteria bacterium]
MLNIKSKIFIGIAIVSFSTASIAFYPGDGRPGFTPGYGDGSRMAAALNMDAKQHQQVKDIMIEHRHQAKTWRDEHRKSLTDKLSRVLNADQLEQFKQHQQQRLERGRGPGKHGQYGKRMSNYGGPGNCRFNK